MQIDKRKRHGNRGPGWCATCVITDSGKGGSGGASLWACCSGTVAGVGSTKYPLRGIASIYLTAFTVAGGGVRSGTTGAWTAFATAFACSVWRALNMISMSNFVSRPLTRVVSSPIAA